MKANLGFVVGVVSKSGKIIRFIVSRLFRTLNRAIHAVMRRRILAIVGGCFIMYGSGVMMEFHPPFVSGLVWETLAFFVHGVGSVPLIKTIEPVWAFVAGSCE